jgi:ubiquinone/menaquinone biosynthesis C-methylase UbiE
MLRLLQCPATGQALTRQGGVLSSADGRRRYRIDAHGIAQFAEEPCSSDARRQQLHYDRVATQYLANLQYPHTQEYQSYLDRKLLHLAEGAALGRVAEVCCGSGEALALLGGRIGKAVGVDVSSAMLVAASSRHAQSKFLFVQGDATALPLASGAFDSVFMLGGIHHVRDRRSLFSEVFRVLAPGGRFFWREPVSDFFLWRWLRALIYRISPALDEQTEQPLLWGETVPVLQRAGFRLDAWRTFGFAGYCLLMNSDVLVFNRALRFVPGIRKLARWMTRVDDLILRLPGMSGSGLIVIGSAWKPAADTAAREGPR